MRCSAERREPIAGWGPWALCRMAPLRRRLLAIEGRPHLVLFRHDEVMVHSLRMRREAGRQPDLCQP